MRASILPISVLIFVLSACSSAEQKPQSRWQVKVKKASDERVWVVKSDGSRQCEGKSKFSPDAAARELTSSGILVFQKASGSDGRVYTANCGAPTGKTVELEIAATDLPAAQALGYRAKTK
jgi:hypothetical protein